MPAGKECYDHLGNKFTSISDMCRHYNISFTNFKGRIENGWALERALTTPIHKGRHTIDHLGNSFKTFTDMCNHWGVDTGKAEARIRNGWSLEEVLTADKLARCEDHLGNRFLNMEDMCKHYNVAVSTYRHRLNRGWSKEKALTLGKCTRIGNKIEFLGIEYINITELMNELSIHIPRDMVYRRLKTPGVELVIALLLIDGDRSNFEAQFIGLNKIAYYKVSWSEDPVSTREIIEHYRPDLLEAYDKSNPTGKYSPYKQGGES